MFLPCSFLKLWLFLWLFITGNTSTSQAQVNETSCPDRCGDVQIPYPFGIGASCSLSDGFIVNCNKSDPNNIRPFLGDMEISSIDLESSQVQVMIFMSYQCYNSTGPDENYRHKGVANLQGTPYVISNEENIFLAVGCDTKAYIYESNSEKGKFLGGCVSWCTELNDIVNDSCSGSSCCEASIPRGIRSYYMFYYTWTDHYTILDFNPCSYAFIVKKDSYNFSVPDLKNMDTNRKLPLVLDWTVGSLTCEEAKKQNLIEYACVAESSYCHEPTDGNGYVCKCSQGYRGNPYLQNGCQDIDECKEGVINCKGDCVNTNGSYTCTCPPGTTGNATGDGCDRVAIKANDGVFSKWAKLGLGIGTGLPLLFIIGSSILWVIQKRKLTKLKEVLFRKNGGLFLQEQLSKGQISTFKIFTLTEMEMATNKFAEERILGKGGNGIVYKGLLQDGVTVAIKKSMMVEEKQSKEFANELLILSQINHVNVVKLLGCCLEVEVPMLVYECISNGTLFQHIHSNRQEHELPWDLRLRIGAQSAKALAYMHTEACPPILHGDIKSSNILLGDNLIAKVSDFGTSIIAPNDKTRFMTVIQGTYGYLDPEYLQTGNLTDKSDVYSFGVVMLELLTGKKAIYKDDENNDKNLASEFISCMKEGRLAEMLDPRIKDGNSSGSFSSSSVEEIDGVANIVLQCLNVTGDERPTITQVYMVLEGSRKLQTNPWVKRNTSVLTEHQQSPRFSNLSTNNHRTNRIHEISTATIHMTNGGS